jgi:formylglycine-generating enzyme required for sulfatase activity
MWNILILESNPTRDLALNQEIRDLEAAIDRSRDREQFSIEVGMAVRPEDLQNLLLKHQPNIVHVCGHGTGETGLVFQDANGHPQIITTDALSNLFALCAESIECVLLNACYSDIQASAIAQHINFVIGMQQAIRDDAARYFAEGFYLALGYGKSIDIAYEWGCNAIQIRLPNNSSTNPHRKLVPVQLENAPVAILPEHLKPTLLRKLTPTATTLKPLTRSESFESTIIKLDSQGKEIDRTQQQTTALITNLGENLDLEMVKIPGGTFEMGSTAEKNTQPIHTVTVPEFYLGKYPVTQAQWQFVATLPIVERTLKAEPSRFEGGSAASQNKNRHPVEQVSWLDATEFCQRLSCFTGQTYRLPSEAEWEYACRAGTTTHFHFGDGINPNVANYNPGNLLTFMVNFVRGSTTEVGHFQVANPFGLYDMHGNVWEWCLDNWRETYVGEPIASDRAKTIDTTAWIGANSMFHPARGGSWDFNQTGCRSAFRVKYAADSTFDFLGFRVAHNII